MSDESGIPPPDSPRPPDAPAAFTPVYVPFGLYPRAAVVETLRRALVVAEVHPEGTRFLFEMHLGAP